MATNNKTAVVFAYHNIGVTGLECLLSMGVDVALVVTHEDNQQENIWFDSVENIAKLNEITVIKPENPNVDAVIQAVKDCQPDWIFSFYYRNMLGADILNIPALGAFNLHGSLLPKYRGRVPINWAIIKGENESGISLHRMVTKPDAGNLIAQKKVAILPNDTAQKVFEKVNSAAEELLLDVIPSLQDNSFKETPLDLNSGSYFGGRQPKDGQINWALPAQQIHNLIRAVAPPYPGAFFLVNKTVFTFLGSYFTDKASTQPLIAGHIRLYWLKNLLRVDCMDGKSLCITQFTCDGVLLDETQFNNKFGPELLVKYE